MSFLSEFKQFAMRGNVMDLAVAVVIGAAFGKIVSSLVDGIIMPIIGLLMGGINITDKAFKIGDAVVKWGAFYKPLWILRLLPLLSLLRLNLLTCCKTNKKRQKKRLAKKKQY